jgi:hypothetical protein
MPRTALALLLPLGCACLGACGLLRSAGETTASLAGAVIPGESKPKPTSPEELLSDLLRYADQSLSQFEQATHAFEVAAHTGEAGLQAALWRMNAYRLVPQLATAPSSLSGLLDLVFVAQAASWLVEDHYLQSAWGDNTRPLATSLKRAEENGWNLLAKHLDENGLAEARAVLAQWRVENPKLTPDSIGSFPSFVALARKTGREGGTGLLGMIGLDPLSSLEPATRELMQMRLLGQRALFYAQILPRVVAAESELALLELRDSREVLQVLSDTQSVGQSVASFAALATTLPEVLRTEREAAIAQVSAELTAQREGLIADLQAAQEPLQKVLVDTRGSLEAGERTAQALTETVRALESWLGSFAKKDEAEDDAAKSEGAVAAPAEPSKKPFDITEYGSSAERIGTAARELTALVAELDQSLPEFQRLVGETTARAERSLDHAALRALEVGLALIAAASVAALLLRRRKAPGVQG